MVYGLFFLVLIHFYVAAILIYSVKDWEIKLKKLVVLCREFVGGGAWFSLLSSLFEDGSRKRGR